MMSAEEAQAFCRAAVDQGFLNSDQVEEFTAQSGDGIQSPGAYFMLYSVLQQAQVEKVNELLRQGGASSGVTRILKEEDTVFHLPPMASAETASEDTKVIDVSDADIEEPEKKPDSGIMDVDGILDMDDTALQLQTMQDDESDSDVVPEKSGDGGFNLLEMDDAALQGGASGDPPGSTTRRHVSPDARAFCEAAVAKGLITPEQAREFEQQADGGFKDPGTFFMLSGGLTDEHVQSVRKSLGASADLEGPTRKLLRSDDSVLELPDAGVEGPKSYVAEEVTDQPRARSSASAAPGPPLRKVETPPAEDDPPPKPPAKPSADKGPPIQRVETPPSEDEPDVQPPLVEPPAVPKRKPAESAKPPVPAAPSTPPVASPAVPVPAGGEAGIGKPSLLGQYMILGELGRGSVGFGEPGARMKVLGDQPFRENELPLFLVSLRKVSGSCVSAPGHGGLYRAAGQPAVCWWTETKSDPSNPGLSRLDFHIEGVQVAAEVDWVAYKVRLT